MRVNKALVPERRSGKYVFCKFYTREDGCVNATFYLPVRGKSERYFIPENGYGVSYDLISRNNPLYFLINQCNTAHDRKVILEFIIHPFAWMGSSWKEATCIDKALEDALNKINFYWWE